MQIINKKLNNQIFFKSNNELNIEGISKDYLKTNPPPPEILDIGIHGSSSFTNTKPHSDIDFYCICKTQNTTTIEYLRRFVENMNQKTQKWVDMIVGNLKNDDAFKLNKFVLNDILKNNKVLYGENLFEHIQIMLKNYKGEDSTKYLYKELQTSGHRIKRAIVDLNNYQTFISKPPVDMNYIKANGIDVKSKTIAKQILASCAFANTIQEIITGNLNKFSKKDAPEKFYKYYNIKTSLPDTARKIYYENPEGIDLNKFSNEDALQWLEIQHNLEKTIQKKINNYNKSKFLSRLKNMFLR